ncbi:hypothetical protein [Zongyangia hominis]|nr:hypothetical protein [Zongyangia hominis]
MSIVLTVSALLLSVSFWGGFLLCAMLSSGAREERGGEGDDFVTK